MGEVISNLKARFGVDAADFKKGLKEAEGSLGDLDKKVGNSVRELTEMLTPMALLAGAGGALALFKSSIEAVEGPATVLESVIGGGKEAMFEMQKALATLDFSGFITNLAEGYKRGKEFAYMLDELAEKTAYTDYVIIALEQEADALRETTKNKTLEIGVRADAAEKVKEIELKIFQRKKKILQETYDIEKLSWEGRNKMTIDEGVKLFETMSKINDEGYDKVSAESVAKIQEAFDAMVKNAQLTGSNMKNAVEDAAILIKNNLAGDIWKDFIKEIPKADLEYLVDLMSKFALKTNTGEKGVWEKLFEVINKDAKAVNAAQKEYNSAIGETTKLLAQEEKQTNKNVKAAGNQTEEEQKQLALQKAKADQVAITMAAISNIKMPDFAPLVDGLQAPKKAITGVFIDFTNELDAVINDTFVGVGNWIGAFASGLEGFRSLRQLIGNSFGNMLISLGTIAIAAGTGIEKIKFAFSTMKGAVAVAAGIGLIAFGAAIKGSIQQVNNARAISGSGGGSESFGSSGGGSAMYGKASTTTASKLKLEGTVLLKLTGADLLAILNNENTRIQITT